MRKRSIEEIRNMSLADMTIGELCARYYLVGNNSPTHSDVSDTLMANHNINCSPVKVGCYLQEWDCSARNNEARITKIRKLAAQLAAFVGENQEEAAEAIFKLVVL